MIVCGDTEVPLEQLEEYVADILSVAHEVSDSTNIELQFKVSGSGREREGGRGREGGREEGGREDSLTAPLSLTEASCG